MLDTKLVRDQSAFDLLADQSFQEAWMHLTTKSEVFHQLQDARYLTLWYTHYQSRFEPILIYSLENDGEMLGFMGLAWHRERNYLVHAGGAEYHGWLARKDQAVTFLRQVFLLVQAKLHITEWRWNCLPLGLRISDIEAAAGHQASILIKKQLNPIWDLSKNLKLEKLLQSRSIRAKIKRLRRRGVLRCEVIENSSRFRQVIQIVSHQCDLRREAINNCRPFIEDPFMIDFCADLLRHSNFLHVCALWLEDQLLAFHMGVIDRKRLSLGLTSYDPTESRLSPGTLLIIKLGERLTTEGFDTFDLTPGGDKYKHRFANSYEVLYRPTIFFSKAAYLKSKFRNAVVDRGKNLLSSAKFDQHKLRKTMTDIRAYLDTLPELSLPEVISNLTWFAFKRKRHLLYRVDLKNKFTSHTSSSILKKQDYKSLLLYQDTHPFLTRRDLLKDALTKFAKGNVLYSKEEDGTLEWLGWVKEFKGPITDTSDNTKVAIERKAKILYDIYAAPTSKTDVFCQCIHEVMRCMKERGEEVLWLVLDRKNKRFLHEFNHIDIKGDRRMYHNICSAS